MRRAIEKENKKFRDAAKKEYVDTVRQLCAYIKKRDKRIITINLMEQEERRKREEADTKKRAEAAARRKQERKKRQEEAADDTEEIERRWTVVVIIYHNYLISLTILKPIYIMIHIQNCVFFYS